MKQAQADADEIIAAYRREQQDAFNKNVAKNGEFLTKFEAAVYPFLNSELNFKHIIYNINL